MLFGSERTNRTEQIRPPFKPYDPVRVVHLDYSGWKQFGLVGKTGHILNAPAIPNMYPAVPGNVWLKVYINGEGTVSLLDTELELLPKLPSAVALDMCHR